MSISPLPANALAAVKTAITEIESIYLTPGVTAVPFPFYEQGTFPYWVNEFGLGAPEDNSTSVLLIPLEMQAIYAGGWTTEGVDGELQDDMLLKALEFVTGFKEYSKLVCPSYPSGVLHIAPDGLIVGKPAKTTIPGENGSTRGLLFPLSVKLKFEISKKVRHHVSN